MNKVLFKKVYYSLKEFICNNKLFLTYMLLSILLSITMRVITIGGFPNFKATLIDFLFSLLIGSFAFLFKPKNRFGYYLFLLLFLTGLSIGNTIYYQFYKSFISVNLISTASMIGQVNDSLWAKIHLIQFVYLIYPIIFIIVYIKLKRIHYFNDKENNITLRTFLFTFILIIIFIICSVTLNDVSKFYNQFNREYIVKKYGVYLYTFNDLFQSMEFDSAIVYDNAAMKFRNYYSNKINKKKEINEYTDKFKGKNVLFIHAESIQNFLIDLKINGEYVTPNINSFAKEGMYFKNFYPQISVGTSSDTEFSLLTGLLPSSKGTVFVNYYDRTYYGMPNYFNNLGYYTFSMHANDRNYWNRAVMHEKLGYQKFYGKESYDVSNIDEIVGLGLSDKSFFKQSISKLEDISKNKNPYFGTIITLSNHSPFNDVNNYGEFDVHMKYSYKDDNCKTISGIRDYLEGTTMGNYIKSAHYADEAFGELINGLKEADLLNNTIIVFYGDHESRISSSEFDYLYNYDPITDDIKDENDPSYISMNNYHYDLLKNTPLIIWSNEEDLSCEINSVMGMYDVLPTIANMFGFNETFSLGHDIFSSEDNIVIFPNGNILTDKVYYSDSNEEYITLIDTPIDSDYINEIKEYANDILEISNGIVYYDLIENEKNNIEGFYEKK